MTKENTAGAAEMSPGAPDAKPARKMEAVWDPLVRLIHWSVALLVLANATFVDDDSKLHEIVGYAAVGLVALRLVWGLIGTRHARFSDFPPNPRAALRHLAGHLTGRHSHYAGHNPAGALMAYNLWATLVGLGVTGYMMGTVQFFGYEWVEELHEALFGWLIASLVLHLGGVALDTLLTRVPLVPAMIHGKKPAPERGDRA